MLVICIPACQKQLFILKCCHINLKEFMWIVKTKFTKHSLLLIILMDKWSDKSQNEWQWTKVLQETMIYLSNTHYLSRYSFWKLIQNNVFFYLIFFFVLSYLCSTGFYLCNLCVCVYICFSFELITFLKHMPIDLYVKLKMNVCLNFGDEELLFTC